MLSVNRTERFSHVEVPRRRASELSGRSENVPRLVELKSTSLLKHTWDCDDRTVLCCLWKSYSNSPKNFAVIFNHLFRDRLRREGYEDGMLARTLQCQWHDMKMGGKGNDIWRKIHISLSLHEVRCKYYLIRNRIETSAIECGVELRLRAQDPTATLKHASRAKRWPEKAGKVGSKRDSTSSDCEEFHTDCESPGKHPRARSVDGVFRPLPTQPSKMQLSMPRSDPAGASTPSLSRPVSMDQRESGLDISEWERRGRSAGRLRKKPKVLFRFHDSSSQGHNSPTGFRAGLFRDQETSIPPPPEQTEFGIYVLAHLTPLEQSTPLISLFESPLNALFRALKSWHTSIEADIEPTACVTIIDVSVLEKSLEVRFPEADETFWAGPTICDRYDLKLRNKYRGVGEFIAWGIVEQSACIGSFYIGDLFKSPIFTPSFCKQLQIPTIQQASYGANLWKILQRNGGPLSSDFGKAVGALLRFSGLPSTHHEVVAVKFAYYWVEGYKTSRDTVRWDRFIAGLHEAGGPVRGASVGVKDEEDEEEIILSESEDGAELLTDTDSDQVDGETDGTNYGASERKAITSDDDEQDVIDRQLALTCAEFNADHGVAYAEKNLTEVQLAFSNIWEFEEKEASPCPPSAQAADTFAEELQEAAIESTPEPELAHITEWDGSWRSITPNMPFRLWPKSTTVEPKVRVIDLTEDTEEDDSPSDIGQNDGQGTRATVKAIAILKEGKSTQGGNTVKVTAKNGKSRRKACDGQNNGFDDDLVEIPSVGLSGE